MKNKRMIKIFMIIVLLISGVFINYSNINAASTIIVHNQDELESAVNDAQENITIELAEDFDETLTSQIDFYIDHQYDIVIDGKGKKLHSLNSEYEKHAVLSVENDNRITIKNITFEGNATFGNSGEPIFENEQYGGLEVSGSDMTLGYFKLENVSFDKINPNGNAALVTNYIGKLEIDNVSFTSNVCESSSSLNANGIGDLLISNSEFKNNINTSKSGSGYFSGNVKLMQVSNNITIKNTLFDKNKTSTSYGSSGAALSISLNGSDAKVTLSDNIFKNNDTDYDSQYVMGKGGAIGIDGIGQNSVVIENSLFNNNHAGTAGSAIFLGAQLNNNTAISENVIISNSTFTKNHSSLQYPVAVSNSSGGVIHLENDSGKFAPKIFQNTVVNNSASYNYDEEDDIDEDTIINKYGVGISAEIYDQSIIVEPEIKGNVFLANKLIMSDGETEVSSDKLNINLPSVTQSNNVGFDNGSPIDKTHTLKNVFGANQVPLKNNNGLFAGIDNNKETIKSFMILPSTNSMGIADNNSIPLVENDQRQKVRSTTQPDIGAVEIGSIKYDANGGVWCLPELEDYKKGLFYEGENPKQIFFAASLKSYLPAIDNNNLSKLDSVFLGWSKDKDSTTADIRPNENVIANEQTVLYAVWKKENLTETKIIINFDKNADDAKDGKFNKLNVLKGYSLKEQNLNFPNPNRKGYKLLGWSLSSQSSKADFNINTKVFKNIKVYAVWKKDNNNSLLPKAGYNIIFIIISLIAAGTLYSYRRIKMHGID